MTRERGIDRRAFCKLAGGGIAVLVVMGPRALLAQDRRRVYPEDLNAYLLIGEDGHVTVFSGKVELGQGVMTAQAQMVAEELGVALESLEMVLGDTDRCPWDMGTFGSLTVRMFGPALRAAAAEGRAVMLKLASARLGAPRERLQVQNGVVTVAGDPAKRVTYGELAQGRKITRLVDEKAVLRAVSDFSVMGRSPQRLDGPAKVSGGAKFAGDLRRPGMLYARILRPPAHGATLASLDSAAAEKLPGVKLVRRDDLVAVLHSDPEAADAALDRLQAKWTLPAASKLDPDTIFDHLLSPPSAPEVKQHRGAGGKAPVGASLRTFESTFRKGYVAHAPIEPHTALAELADGRMTVWSSTQTPFPTKDRVADALAMPKEKVRVITPYVGGGFGGKSAGQQAVEAARLAQATGKPVMVAWDRAEEFFYDTFDPACIAQVASGCDGDGRIAFWDYEVHGTGDRGADLFYDVANVEVRTHGGGYGTPTAGHPFATGPWRAPGANMNVFAMESQIDRMAAALRLDPLELRLRNLKDARMRRVLQAAADAFGWKSAPGPSGQGRAIACGIDSGTYAALAAQVEVDKQSGAVKVVRIVGAQDMGVVVNPDGARQQMEGAITMGLGYVLAEELRFKGGDVLDRNFATYHLPRFSWLPKVETVLVRNDELAPQGGGEPAIVPMGAVIANAVFDASGARLYRLPLTPERVKEALRSA